MKAAFRSLAEFVNIGLFLLTTSDIARLLLLATTLCAWWFLSDYYFAPWPWWMDRFAFMAGSLVLFFVLTAAVLSFGIHRPARGRSPDFDPLSGSTRELELTAKNWSAILDAISGHEGRLWAAYWSWYSARIKHLGSNSKPITADRLRTCWWFHPSAIPQWMALACLPASWALLLLVPLHTNVIEKIASVVATQPQVIRGVSCSIQIGSPSRSNVGPSIVRTQLDEPLDGEPFGYKRKEQCDFPAGAMIVSSNSFPRVYNRKLEVNCHEHCDLRPLGGGGEDLLSLQVPVVAGKASFGEASFLWFETIAPSAGRAVSRPRRGGPTPDTSVTSLGMTVFLLRQDGSTLDKVAIEP